MTLDQQQPNENAGVSGWIFGDGTGESKVGTTFTPSVTAPIAKFTFKLRKFGTPSDNVKVELYTNSADVPNTLLATATEQVSGTSIPAGTTFTEYDFNFPNGPTLQAETLYWIVVSRTGSLDASNYYSVKDWFDNRDGYPRGVLHDLNTGVWTQYDDPGLPGFNDFYFKEYCVTPVGVVSSVPGYSFRFLDKVISY